MKNKKYFKAFQTLIFLIPLGVLGNLIIAYCNTNKQLFRTFNSFSLEYLALAFILAMIPWLTNSIRLMNWTCFLGKRLRLLDCYKILLGAELGSAVMPRAIGGGYIKIGMLMQRGFSSGAATSLMVLGTVEDILFIIFALPFAIIRTGAFHHPVIIQLWEKLSSPSVALISGFASVAIFYIIFFTMRKKNLFFCQWQKNLKKFFQDFTQINKIIIQRGKKQLLINEVFTIIQWSCRYSIISALLACFHVPVEPLKFFLFQWLVFTMVIFVPTPGGAMATETAFYYVFKDIIPFELLILATSAWRILTFYLQLALGSIIFSLLNLKDIRKKHPLHQNAHKAEMQEAIMIPAQIFPE